MLALASMHMHMLSVDEELTIIYSDVSLLFHLRSCYQFYSLIPAASELIMSDRKLYTSWSVSCLAFFATKLFLIEILPVY